MSNPAPAPSKTPLFTDDLLVRLRRVILRSRRLTNAGLTGEHRSLRKGPSPEFSDFKPYTEGDDFRRVDWNAYARFDELVVRESDTTTEFDVHVLIDVSRSMNWSGAENRSTKLRVALQLAGAVGYLSLWHFDRLTITPLGSNAEIGFGPVQGRANIVPMLRYLERLTSRDEIDLASTAGRYVHLRRRPGMLVIVSDFLSGEAPALEATVQGAAARGWQTVLVQVVDPVEEDPESFFDPANATEIQDAESGTRLRIRGDNASLTTYREQRAVWTDELARIGSGARSMHIPVSTDQPVEEIVLRLLRAQGLVTR